MSPDFEPDGYKFLGHAISTLARQKLVTIVEARKEMRRRLAAGEVVACLFHPRSGEPLKIAAHAWNVEKCIPWLEAGQALVTAAEWGHWRDPHQAAPLCWIFIDESEADAIPASAEQVASSKTGAPGRPTSRHLVETEFKRRIEANDLETSLNLQAEVLSNWLTDTHPKLAPMAPSTVADRIRSLWRKQNPVK